MATILDTDKDEHVVGLWYGSRCCRLSLWTSNRSSSDWLLILVKQNTERVKLKFQLHCVVFYPAEASFKEKAGGVTDPQGFMILIFFLLQIVPLK